MKIMPFSFSHLSFSMNITWACISLLGAATAARADTDLPAITQPALFSWGEVPASHNPPSSSTAEKVTIPDNTVPRTVLQDLNDPEIPRDDFWKQNQKWPGILPLSDVDDAPAYARFVTALKRAAAKGALTEIPQKVLVLAGLAIAGVFLLRYLGKLYYSQLFYHDCGRKGGYLLASHQSGTRRSRHRSGRFSQVWQFLPRFLKRRSPEFERVEKPLSVNG